MVASMPPLESFNAMSSLHSRLEAQQATEMRTLVSPAVVSPIGPTSGAAMSLALPTTPPIAPTTFGIPEGDPSTDADTNSGDSLSSNLSSQILSASASATMSATNNIAPPGAVYTSAALPNTLLTLTLIIESSRPAPSFALQPTTLGSSGCETVAACAAETKRTEDHRSAIAGGIIGTLAAIVLTFGIYMLWKSKHRKLRETKIEEEAPWSEKKRPESDLSSSSATVTVHGDDESKLKLQVAPQAELADTDFGQTTTWVIGGRKDSAACTIDESRGRSTSPREVTRDITLKLSNTANAENKPSTEDQAGQSPDIGVAVSRYSTAETFTAPIISRASSPAKVAQITVPARPQLSQRASASTPQLLNRSSSISAQSEAQTIFVGKANTARRHSLTPRIINIVAGSPIDVGKNIMSGSKENFSPYNVFADPHAPVHARSSSASKAFQLYTGSPVKLSNHFGISTWNTSKEPGRTSSETLKRTNSNTADEATRGRTRERAEHINYPPTSYPALGRTMSEVKRTIRTRKGDAFVSTSSRSRARAEVEPELPPNVTVTRGGKRSPRKIRGRS